MRAKFRLDIRKNFFLKGVVNHWNRLFNEVVEFLFTEIFKRHVDVAFVDMFSWT